MKNLMIKASVAAAMLVAGTLAHAADSLAVTVTPGTAVQGGVATTLLNVQLDASYELLGAMLTLDWEGAALAFLPMQSSTDGIGYADVVILFDPEFSSVSLASGSFGLSAAFLAPQGVGPGAMALSLPFQGLQVGTHTVTYYLELADALGTPLVSSGAFDTTITAVPEPATYALMLGGLAAVGALARRRSRAA